MKRIIALIASALYAVFANLSPVLPKDAPFFPDSYYQVSETGEVDYSKLFAEYFNSQAVYVGTCDTSHVSAENAVKPDGQSIGLGFYWLLPLDDSSTVSVGSLQSAWDSTDKEGIGIVAPLSGTLETSHNNCNNGSLMTVRFTVYQTDYIMTLTNLKCWWCCRDKDEPEDGKYSLSRGVKDPKGMIFNKGDLMAIATKDTKVTITLASQTTQKLSLDDFYSLQPASESQ